MPEYSVKISRQEFDFLRVYIDIASPTFGNAYQSAIKAGYSKSYARVIKRHYSFFRMQLLKNTLKDDGLVRMIEALRGVDLGDPIMDEEDFKRIMRKKQREDIGMTTEEVIRALDQLLGKL